MRVLLDTNVVLDVLLQRGEWLADAEAIWQASIDGRLHACIGASSLTDIYYIIRRSAGRDVARTSIERCLTELTILPVDRSVLQQAHTLGGDDFEDALQIAIADRDGLDALVTRDLDGFTQSPVPVLTPQQLSQQLATPD